ncbi:MAG: serine hydrolase family protein [Candidatus Magasanikbacteria bacterium]|nr:serine hydrolase family protein [Candidatus Magasanikbacteria bacterium]
MKRIFIIHGWEGSPEKDWLPSLKAELEKLGHLVFIPEMPDTNTPVIERWVTYLASLVGKPDKDTYFVGHSIGCQTILRYLETVNAPVGGAVFVAGWFDLENLENDKVKEIAKPWLTTPINIAQVKQLLPQSVLVISDNDPYGAFSKNKEKFSELGSRIITLHNAGHITEADGFIDLPIALKELANYINLIKI